MIIEILYHGRTMSRWSSWKTWTSWIRRATSGMPYGSSTPPQRTTSPFISRNHSDWFFPEYDDIPLFSRLSIARLMAVVSMRIPTIEGETLRFALSRRGGITPDMVNSSATEELSILHTFRVALADSSLWRKTPDNNMNDIELTLKNLVTMSTDLHHRERVMYLQILT